MKFTFAILFAQLPALVSIVASVYLAGRGVEGWGWFLFVGVLCALFASDDKISAKS
jgi:hypothetical protein